MVRFTLWLWPAASVSVDCDRVTVALPSWSRGATDSDKVWLALLVFVTAIGIAAGRVPATWPNDATCGLTVTLEDTAEEASSFPAPTAVTRATAPVRESIIPPDAVLTRALLICATV